MQKLIGLLILVGSMYYGVRLMNQSTEIKCETTECVEKNVLLFKEKFKPGDCLDNGGMSVVLLQYHVDNGHFFIGRYMKDGQQYIFAIPYYFNAKKVNCYQ